MMVSQGQEFAMETKDGEQFYRMIKINSDYRPLKIATIGSVNGLGGSQTAFKNLLSFLKAEGHSTFAIAIGSEKQAATIKEIGEHICIRHESESLFGKFTKSLHLYLANRKVRFFMPDLFISMGVTRSANYIAERLAFSSYKLTIDYMYGREINDPLLKSAMDVFGTYAVQSHSMMHAIESMAGPAKLTWLPCFPTPPIKGILRESHVSPIAIRIAFFGRLASNKGIDLIINAISQQKHCPMVHFDIWGSGPMESEIENQIGRLQLQKIVSLKGRYPEGEAYARLLISYDAIVLPSTEGEGLPLVLLEAMAYGVPYLTTDVGAIKDCCVNNPDAIMVAPTERDVCAGLTMLIERLQSNNFFSKRLQAYYNEYYSYDVMKSRWRRFLSNPNQFTGDDV